MTTHVALLVYEPDYGGQSTHVLALAQGLDRRRYAVSAVIPDHSDLLAERLRAAGVSVTPMRLHRLNNLSAMLQLAKQLRREGVGLFHVHGAQAGLFGRVAARLAGVPAVVYTPHTIDMRRHYTQRLYFWLERLLTGWTDVIISVNEADRERLIRARVVPAEKIVTVHYGINADRFRRNPLLASRARQALGVPERAPLVVQIGRLHVEKGPSFLVQAAALVLQQHPEARFVLVGEGPLRADLTAQIAALDVADQVLLAGWWSDVTGILAAADVVALASLWEGLPFAVLEAMAAERPVVATSVNGCREIITDGVNGLLVPLRDPHALAMAIGRLLDDPAFAAQLARAGHQTIEEQYSPRAAIAAVQAVYERVLAAKGQGARTRQ
jgi:glycosyltransferase involved in cell wall biosynthesis